MYTAAVIMITKNRESFFDASTCTALLMLKEGACQPIMIANNFPVRVALEAQPFKIAVEHQGCTIVAFLSLKLRFGKMLCTQKTKRWIDDRMRPYSRQKYDVILGLERMRSMWHIGRAYRRDASSPNAPWVPIQGLEDNGKYFAQHPVFNAFLPFGDDADACQTGSHASLPKGVQHGQSNYPCKTKQKQATCTHHDKYHAINEEWWNNK